MKRTTPQFRAGHRVQLLQGAAELFPALAQAMDGARHTVLFETYIFDTTGAGAEVAEALMRAAQRGHLGDEPVDVVILIEEMPTRTL